MSIMKENMIDGLWEQVKIIIDEDVAPAFGP